MGRDAFVKISGAKGTITWSEASIETGRAQQSKLETKDDKSAAKETGCGEGRQVKEVQKKFKRFGLQLAGKTRSKNSCDFLKIKCIIL